LTSRQRRSAHHDLSFFVHLFLVSRGSSSSSRESHHRDPELTEKSPATSSTTSPILPATSGRRNEPFQKQQQQQQRVSRSCPEWEEMFMAAIMGRRQVRLGQVRSDRNS